MVFKFKKDISIFRQVYFVFTLGLVLVFFGIWLFFSPFRDQIQSKIGSFLGGIYSFRLNIVEIGGSFFSAPRLEFDNNALKEELSILKTKVMSTKNIIEENEFLRKQLGLSVSDGSRLLLAYVSYPDDNPFKENVILNVGTREGVKVGDLAIVANALVGKIVSATIHTSELQLITDNNSIYPVVIKSSEDSKGICQGNLGKSTLTINNVLKKIPISIGDSIVLSSDRNYFTNSEILIGTVEEVSDVDNEAYKLIKANPALDLSKLKRVFIIT